MALPLSVNHLRNTEKESESYKISDSPMSLSSLLHIIFIKGHGPLKCFMRKLLMIAVVLLTIFPTINHGDAAKVMLFSFLSS